MMNPISKWLNSLIFGHQFYFAGISASTAAAVAASAASAAGSLMSAGSGEDAAAAAGANASQISQQQISEARKARDSANKYQLPYYNTGTQAQNRLSYLLGLGNTIQTPTDTSYGAYKADQQRYLDAHLANKPSAKNKRELIAWQKEKKKREDSLKKATQDSEGYKNWAAKREGVASTEVPIDSTYGSLLKDFTEEDFRADPGYNFRKEQGDQELNRRLSAMGLTTSGAALKEGQRFSQGLADQAYQGAFDRYMQQKGYKTSTLFGMAGTGQRAADNISNNENTYGANVTQSLANKGAAQQNALYEGANARAGGYAGISNAVGGLADNLATYGGYKSGIKRSYANQGIDSSAWGS